MSKEVCVCGELDFGYETYNSVDSVGFGVEIQHPQPGKHKYSAFRLSVVNQGNLF